MSEVQNQRNQEEKTTMIVVNGREREFAGKEISYAEVVKLAYENPPFGPDTLYTVTYARGEPPKHEGTLVEGQTVKVKKGMVFNVGATNKS